MVHALKRNESALRLLLAGVAALSLAGCADSSRMDDPFANPFKTSSSARYDRTPTGSTVAASDKMDFFSETFRTFDGSKPRSASSMELRSSNPPRPVASLPIESRPLPPAPIVSQPLPAPRVAATPVVAPRGDVTPRNVAARVGGWSIAGGVPVVVAQGETAGMIANRYGVPTETMLQLNGYRTANQVQPGSRLTIPVYSAGGVQRAETPRMSAPAPRMSAPVVAKVQEEAAPAAKKTEHFALKQGPKSLVEEENENEAKAAAPRIDAMAARKAKLAEARAAAIKEAASAIEKKKAQDSQNLAAQKLAAAEAKKQAAEAARAAKQAAAAQAATPAQTVAEVAKPVIEKPVVKQQVASAPEEDATARTTPAGDSANPEFRWPARGRVIQAYGNGGNDGINIAVPEGTAVKAAEGGTVTYAGSELKGYGNLVLIHHPNGFDSVYANNGSINVKKGDTVKRGQTIALSGQSGNVASPQLHFELRKGHKPVDPTSYLAGL